MQKKIETLEKLVSQACSKISELASENRSLANKLKAVNTKFNEFASDKEKLNKLISWKNKTRERLKKIKAKAEFLISQSKKH
jgi:uncharacterized protein YdcH (DUF465 family)